MFPGEIDNIRLSRERGAKDVSAAGWGIWGMAMAKEEQESEEGIVLTMGMRTGNIHLSLVCIYTWCSMLGAWCFYNSSSYLLTTAQHHRYETFIFERVIKRRN